MDKIIIRESISFVALSLITIVLFGVVLGGFFIVYTDNFNEEMSKVQVLIEEGEWEDAESGLAELKERSLFTKHILMMDLIYHKARYVENKERHVAMEVLARGNYLHSEYPELRDDVVTVLGELYYSLGGGYYLQAWRHLQDAYKIRVDEDLVKEEELVFFKKFYTMSLVLERHKEARVYLKKLMKLEPENYAHSLRLATQTLAAYNYDEVRNILEDVMYLDVFPAKDEQNGAYGKYSLSLQRSGMMLYVLALYLKLETDASFYQEYVTEKVLQVEGFSKLGEQDLRKSMQIQFESLDIKAFNGGLPVLIELFKELETLELADALVS